jgi:hypothetical protein
VPRSIIDTESSRPRLLRRRVIVALVLLMLVLALIFGVWEGLHHSRGLAFQGNSGRRLNLDLREDAT